MHNPNSEPKAEGLRNLHGDTVAMWVNRALRAVRWTPDFVESNQLRWKRLMNVIDR